mmetsp:Transcript_10547/g.28142  ORF Transcript_10547/g.28142 Transcript_10547/m.28142 type:complete len:201 (-) Transcript_10547:197-799(-)
MLGLQEGVLPLQMGLRHHERQVLALLEPHEVVLRRVGALDEVFRAVAVPLSDQEEVPPVEVERQDLDVHWLPRHVRRPEDRRGAESASAAPHCGSRLRLHPRLGPRLRRDARLLPRLHPRLGPRLGCRRRLHEWRDGMHKAIGALLHGHLLLYRIPCRLQVLRSAGEALDDERGAQQRHGDDHGDPSRATHLPLPPPPPH